MNLSYQYDIFISYKRGKETVHWIEEHFQPLLEHSVELELGRKPIIFRDDQLSDGGTWPIELGIALGSSRVLIPLWSKAYFHSEWCVRELVTMLEREQEMGCRTKENPNGLVIPTVIHDYLTDKPNLKHIQYREIRKCFNVRMARYSERAEQLADELSAAAPGIAKAIENIPEWQAHWPGETADDFMQALWIDEQPKQTQVPGFSA